MLNRILHSRALLPLLAALLVLAFFLPDLIGPLPAIIIGGLVVGLCLFVYGKWSQATESDQPRDGDQPSGPDENKNH